MIVAVTGGTGFIGKVLVKQLIERGDEVRVFSRKPSHHDKRISVKNLDLISATEEQLSQALNGVEVLYHCAGQLTNTAQMQALHVDATKKLVAAASQKIKHWVQLSSVGVYGPVNAVIVTETTPLNPIGPYETTKAESDQIVLEAAANGAFTFTVLRPSNVFGNDMTNQSLFGLISIIDRGLFFYIGKRGASANYIHVENVVRGLIMCGTETKSKEKIFNLSDQIKIENFVELISGELGRKPPVLRIPKSLAIFIANTLGRLPGVPLSVSRVNALSNFSSYPIAKIETELNYTHKISLEDGLRDLVKFYKTKI